MHRVTPFILCSIARTARAGGLVLTIVALIGSLRAAEPRKVTYEDDVLPIFRNN